MGTYEKLRKRMDCAGLRPSVRRGQNFLLDGNQLQFIADCAALEPADVVLEVGPGSGLLTRRLARTGCLLLGVELDHGLLPLAEEETAGFPNVFFLRGDILAGKNRLNPDAIAKLEELLALKGRTLEAEASGKTATLKCVSNLPYSAGTAFVMNLLSSPLPWRTGVFLLQREVGERLRASPGGKDYGAISIAAGLAARTTIERIVPPKVFWPRPKVDSAVVRMDFKPAAERLALPWAALRATTNAVFGSRRKILKNAMKGLFGDRESAAILAGIGLDPEGRGETLSPEEFLRLAQAIAPAAAEEQPDEEQ